MNYDLSFSAPLLEYKPENSEELCDILVKTANNLEDSDDNGGILSENWSEGKRAKNKKDYKKGGYTSFYTQNIFEIKELKPLHEEAIKAFMSYNYYNNLKDTRGFLDHAWVSTYHIGHHVPRHIHSNSHLSCVFYGASDSNSGEIRFHNPFYNTYGMLCDKDSNPFIDNLTLEAKKGYFYIFPSFMPHETKKHMGKDKRVIYSANYVYFKSRLGKHMWHHIDGGNKNET